MMMKFSLLLVALVANADAFTVGGSRSFAARRSSSLSMNVENMPAKKIIKVGVIGM